MNNYKKNKIKYKKPSLKINIKKIYIYILKKKSKNKKNKPKKEKYKFKKFIYKMIKKYLEKIQNNMKKDYLSEEYISEIN